MRIAVPWHEMPRQCPSVSLFRSPGLVDRDRVVVTIVELVQLFDELVSSLVSERLFMWTIGIATVSWFLLFGLCVLGGLPSCAPVVGCGCVVELMGTCPCDSMYFLLLLP